MSKNTQLKLQKRLRPLYLASFFQSFVLWYGIEKLFMRSIGLQDAAIALSVVIFNAALLIANIPSGILADRWSRKGVLMLASLSLVINCVIASFSNSFWTYTAAACFWGIFFACYQGTYDAIIYDTLLEENGDDSQFEHYYGRTRIISSVGLVCSSLISGIVAHYINLRADYFLSIPFALAAIVALVNFKEPLLHKQATKQLMGAHVIATLRAVLRRGLVFWIVFAIVFAAIGFSMMAEFDQLWLLRLHVSTVWYGVVNAVMLSSIGIGGFLAGSIKRSQTRTLLVGVAVLAAGSALLVHNLTVVIAQALFFGGCSLLGIILSRHLHNALPSNLRTGASSVAATIGSIVFLPIALSFGIISQHHGIFTAAWIPACIGVITFCGLFIMLRYKPAAG